MARTRSKASTPSSSKKGLGRRCWHALKAVVVGLGRYFKRLVDPTLSRTRRVFYALGGLFVGGGVATFLLFTCLLVLYPFTPGLKDLRRLKVQQPTVVRTADGHELRQFQRYNRHWVALDDIAPHVREALIATEDHRFYGHHGVDFRRLIGSAVYTALGDRQGGSTLTMQLARNLYPARIGRASSMTRKFKEIITAFKIEYAYEKDEILETYLNTVPFLYNAYGIEMAARTYFGKPARRLDLLESATLVGMLKATSYYNPVRNPERALARRNVVLGQMVKHGLLTPHRLEQLRARPVRLRFSRQALPGQKAPHFTEQVRRWLVAWAEDEGYDLYTDGLTVHTTLDWQLQRLAARAVIRQGQALQDVADVEWAQAANPLRSASPHDYAAARRNVRPFAYFWEQQPQRVDRFIRETRRYRRGVDAGRPPDDGLNHLRTDEAFMDSLRAVKTRVEAGFVALEPRTGHVKAWVGSRGYARDKFDHVAQARRQPGSTFKPFVYAAALEAGYEPDDTFPDRAVEIEVGPDQVWRPVNAGGFSGRDVTLREALAQSKNGVTAQLIAKVGPRRTARLARRMGVNRSELQAVPSLALGTSEVTLLEMASAYATIAGGGVYRAPVLVSRIVDAEGNVVYQAPAREERVLSEQTAHRLLDMMRDVIDEGTGRRIRSVFGVRCDVAGKTGTTQDNADGWFLLMHPHLVGGGWVGFNDPRVTFRSDYWGQGAHNALYVVGDFFRHALRQGRLDPRPRLAPEPITNNRPSFFARAGDWLKKNFNSVLDSFRGDDAPEEALPAPRRHRDEQEQRTHRVEFHPPRRAPERLPRHTEERWKKLQEAARAAGRVADEVGDFLEAQDENAADVYREHVDRYLRDAERYLHQQQRLTRRDRRRRWVEEALEDHLDDLLDHYAAELGARQRREVEHFLRELRREIERH